MTPLRDMIEIVSHAKLIMDGERRNRTLFDNVGLHKLSQHDHE